MSTGKSYACASMSCFFITEKIFFKHALAKQGKERQRNLQQAKEDIDSRKRTDLDRCENFM